jgi:hypothetical protein
MRGRPQASEAASYYFAYIDRVTGDDVLPVLARQLDETLAWCAAVTDERSRFRYAPDKWSIRQVLNHISDTERVFAFRALWFARGFSIPLPSFDQTVAAAGAGADSVPWAAHVEDFRRVRLATLSLFQHLPSDAWARGGVASDHHVTVRALAYVIAGHLAHHMAVLSERYA